MDIEVVYRIKIFYEMVDSKQVTMVENKVFEWGYKVDDVKVVSDTGGACWGPYFILEGNNKANVLRFARKIESYIRRFKGFRIL